MKLFGRTIFEKFKGFFASTAGIIPQRREFWATERSWQQRCKRAETIYLNHPLAKSMINTIAGQLVADGIFLQPATDMVPHDQRAKDALYECEQLNKRINLATMLYDTTIDIVKYGSCFWELSADPFDARIIPMQETIEPAVQDETGNIVAWRQRLSGKETARWTSDEIIHFAWNTTSFSWPYGTSLLSGLDTEFEILEQMEIDIKEYAHKTSFPMEFLSVGDKDLPAQDTDVSDVRTQARQWGPGEKIVSNFPLNYVAGGTGDREPKAMDKILTFLKEQAIDGLMMPPVSYQYSSTYASSKEMAKIFRANLILPLQRIEAWHLESELYKPYLETLNFSVKLCPVVGFDPPDANFAEEAQAYTSLVTAGIYTWDLAARKMGCTEEEIEQMRMEKLKAQKQAMDVMKQKMDFTANQKEKEKPFEQTQGSSGAEAK